MQTFLKSILILHENREKSKLFKQIYRLKLAFSHTSCIYFTELHLTFYLTNFKSFQQKILINISNAAPGTPNIPTIIELIILKPI